MMRYIASMQTPAWIFAIHVLGIVGWVSGMLSCLFLLRTHASIADRVSRERLSKTELRAAMLMDIGATLAIVGGVYLAFFQSYNPFIGAGWLHAKLTVVVALLAIHVIIRMKVGKFSRGHVGAVSGNLLPIAIAIVIVIVFLARTKPF